jgi:hypothetical protein
MAKRGPKGPSKPLTNDDLQRIISMVRIQCTADEICQVFDMSRDTLNRRLEEHGEENFSTLYKKHRAEGKASLRRAQWQFALAGNPSLLIWLGKNELGQTDQIKQEIDLTARVAEIDYTKLSTEALLELSRLMADANSEDNDV